MKLSTKGRYGLRAMADLAVNAQEGHVALCSIAGRQDISVNYLEQVFSILRKADLVNSIKGAQGGYTLTGNPADIKVGDILRALEGQLSVTDDDPHTGIYDCIRDNVYERMNACLNSLVDSMTLEDLADIYRKMNGIYTPMYHI